MLTQSMDPFTVTLDWITIYRYVAYVGFMKFNEPAEDALRKCFGLPPMVSVKTASLLISRQELLFSIKLTNGNVGCFLE